MDSRAARRHPQRQVFDRLRRYIDAAGGHQPERGDNDLGLGGLGNEAVRAGIEHAEDGVAIAIRRQHHHRQLGKLHAEARDRIDAFATRQTQIEEHEVGRHRACRPREPGLERGFGRHRDVAECLAQHRRHDLVDQRMVVDDQRAHGLMLGPPGDQV
jgi:hypothetical protein